MKIKSLAKNSLIYSVGSLVNKASGVVLIPIYTEYFSLNEFGVLALLISIITIGSQVFSLGQGHAIIRYSNDNSFSEKKESIFFTLTLFVILTVCSLFFLGELSKNLILNFLNKSGDFRINYEISIWIISLTLLNNFFLNKLRAEEKAVQYTFLNIIKFGALIVFSIIYIIYLKAGVTGALYSQLFSEILLFVLITPFVLKYMKIKLEPGFITDSLKFGLPLNLAVIAMSLLISSDRFIIEKISGSEPLGLYDLGYRIAGVLNILIVSPLTLSLLPFAFQLFRQPKDKYYYQKFLTFGAFLLTWCGLVVSFFGREIIEILSSNPSFLEADKVIPLIVLSYVFYGLNWIASLGMNLTNKTGYIAVNTFLATLLNIGLNIFLIPQYGITAAAFNTVLAFILLYFLSVKSSNKFYYIKFEHLKVFTVVILGIIVFCIIYNLEVESKLILILIKVIVSFLFPLLLYWLKFFETQELMIIKDFVTATMNRSGKK